MDSGNLIAFLKKFSFGRLIGCGIVLRIAVALVDGVTRSSEPFQSAETVLSLLCQDLNPCCTKYEVK